MVERTSTKIAPWTLVEGNDKNFARIKVLRTLARTSREPPEEVTHRVMCRLSVWIHSGTGVEDSTMVLSRTSWAPVSRFP